MTLARDLLARYPWLHRAEMRRRELLSRLTRRGVVRRYLARTPLPRLQIGAGQHVLDGWLNTDRNVYRRGAIVYVDARRPLPLPDGAFAYVFTEHQIEHITVEAALAMLRECHRVMRPGGRIRVVTPDLAWVESLAAPQLSAERARYVAWMSEQMGLPGPDAATVIRAMHSGFELVPGAGHQHIYSFEFMRATLERAGFRDVTRCVMQQSTDPNLAGIEGHGAAVGNEEIARLESLVVEAVRP